MKRAVIASIAGIALLVWIVVYSPFSGSQDLDGFGQVFRIWGDKQEQTSEELTDAAVSGAEGSIVGEHEVDGSNWSIPSIIRNFLGGVD